MKRTKIKALLDCPHPGRTYLVGGWVKTKRESKNVVFINLNDGSVIHNLQVVANPAAFEEGLLREISTGACISVSGTLQESPGSGQQVELLAEDIILHGAADPAKYPLQPKRHSMEFLRENAHLRPRTNIFSSVLRIRHALAFSIHKFFNDKGFVYFHSPIITASDCEGAGEMFRVTTLDLASLPLNEDGNIDNAKDFYGREAYLTVSGQLEAELGALGLGEVYTFAPTFRAENSNTSRHLSEFWMIEPEMAFYDITDNMDLAEEFLKFIVDYALTNCPDDIEFLEHFEQQEDKLKPAHQRHEMPLGDRLRSVPENDFQRISYTEAFDILRNSKPNKKKKFNYLIEEWGCDLQSEHERYLVEKHFKRPVIISDYPKQIKAFYMKVNDDGKTVRAMDILFPGIGEIVGGSQREERLDILCDRIEEVGLSQDVLWWYIDTRRFGSVEHSGFGLGFERLVQFVTGMGNIRDVIPFPRTPQSADF